jgi:hypothetical protein
MPATKNLNKTLSGYAAGIIFMLLGSLWAISSPISAAADDDFNLTSIWCAAGPAEQCIFLENGNVKVPEKLNSSVPEKGITGNPPCFVNWIDRSQSAGCLSENSVNLVETSRINKGYNPTLFYRTLNFFIDESSIESSVRNMKIFNVLIFSLLLIAFSIAADKKLFNKFILTLGLALSPVGIIMIGSTNTSSWLTTGLIYFSAFLYNLVVNRTQNHKYLNFLGLVVSILLMVGSRNESYFFILLTTLSVLSLKQYKKFRIKELSITLFFIITLIIILTDKLITRYGSFWNFRLNGERKIYDFTIPREIIINNQPNALINLVIELPSYVYSFLGGQKPIWIQPRGGLGRDFGYGVGWLEFNFPSLTGIFLLTVVFYLLLQHLKYSNKRSLISIFIILSGSFLLILFMRARTNFTESFYFQTRYMFPIFMVIIFLSLANSNIMYSIFGKIEKLFLISMIFTSTTFAWLFYISRYSSGLNFPYTTFNAPIEWWPLPQSFGKLQLFLLFITLNILWLIISVWRPMSKNLLLDQENKKSN